MSEYSSIKLPTFDGKDANFSMFWMRFKAYAGVKGFLQALQEVPDKDMPLDEATVLDLTDPQEALQIAAKKRNALAVASYTMAFTTNTLMMYVQRATTENWPGGLSHLITRALFARYRPRDNISHVELRLMLNKVQMKNNDSPEKLFEQLSAIEAAYGDNDLHVDEADLMAIVFTEAPKMYQSVLSGVQLEKNTNLKMTDLEAAMYQVWRQNNAVKNRDDDKEVALAAVTEITCFKCGAKGHKSNDPRCPKYKKRVWKQGKKGKDENDGTKCKHCGKPHPSDTCWSLPENASKRPANYKGKVQEVGAAAISGDSTTCKSVEYMLAGIEFPTDISILEDPNVWIADSATTVHNTPYSLGMVNLKKVNEGETITMANGTSENTSMVGDMRGMMCDHNGNQVAPVRMGSVKILPSGKFNLFSLSKLTKDGWTMTGDKNGIQMVKGDMKVVFDLIIPTKEGILYAIYIQRGVVELAGTTQDEKAMKPKAVVKIPIKKAHEMFGHSSEEATRKTANALGIVLSRGELGTCEACTEAKAKQKNLHAKAPDKTKKAEEVNGRVYLDLSTIKAPKNLNVTVSLPVWRIIVDEKTGFKTSDFYDKKNRMVDPTCALFQRWKESNKPVKIVRMDNAGENKVLEEKSNGASWKLGIKYEYTARDTPQQNSLAEVGFALIANKGRALMANANVPLKIRYKVVSEAFKTATLLDGLVVVTIDGKTATRYEHWAESIPQFTQHLRTWGEAGTVKIKTLATAKVADRGLQCMFVGYAIKHSPDTYRMWNPNTNKVLITRDIIWLRRMYYNIKMKAGEVSIPDGQLVDANQDEEEVATEIIIEGADNAANMPPENEEAITKYDEGMDDDETTEDDRHTDEDEDQQEHYTTRYGRVVNKPTLYNPEVGMMGAMLTDAETNYYNAVGSIEMEFACVGAGLGGGFIDTNELHVMKFNEAMATQDKNHWIRAVDEEHQRMKDHGVFQPVNQKDLKAGTKIISSTWSMKKKSNGVFRARMVARGFEQIPGKHYDDQTKASPVISHMTVMIMFTLMTMGGLYAHILDVNGAFLLGEFDRGEEIHLEVPQGFEKFYEPGTVLLLKKTLYGLIQAAIAFWKTLGKSFKRLEYKRSHADPCLHYRWENEQLVLWASWVDDLIACGPKDLVLKEVQRMKGEFKCDDGGAMTEYVGGKIDYKPEDHTMKITQPVLLQSFEDEFEVNKQGREVLTPAGPNTVLGIDELNPEGNDELKTMYRKGVGKLLHLTRWSRPEIMNAVRELSRHAAVASQKHINAMLRCMSYCVQTSKRGKFLKPNMKWDGSKNTQFVIYGMSDSDFAKDPLERRSVSGYCTFLCGVPISEKSKMQNHMTLSVTEAEAASAVTCAQDMLFAMHLLESVGLQVKKPMFLYVDNKGAVDLFNGWGVSGRTRHVAVKLNFLRELKEEGTIEVKWFPSEKNAADLFTKNLGGELFDTHAKMFCGDDEYYNTKVGTKKKDSRSNKVLKLQGESVRAPKLPSLVWSVTERLQLANGIDPNGKDPNGKDVNESNEKSQMRRVNEKSE